MGVRELSARCAHLPIELLQKIFGFATVSKEGAYYDELYTLILVCRAWHDIILRTPEFWFILNGESPVVRPFFTSDDPDHQLIL